jgi:AbrB family looped-hinge helix DNA binding protein
MKAKVARRFQITIPEDVREEVGINVGDVVDVSSHEGKVVIEKVGRNWDEVMNQTRGAWKTHPAFVGLKDSVEITRWLRNKRAKK